MAMKFAEPRFEKLQNVDTFDLRDLFILRFDMAYSSRYSAKILFDVVLKFIVFC